MGAAAQQSQSCGLRAQRLRLQLSLQTNHRSPVRLSLLYLTIAASSMSWQFGINGHASRPQHGLYNPSLSVLRSHAQLPSAGGGWLGLMMLVASGVAVLIFLSYIGGSTARRVRRLACVSQTVHNMFWRIAKDSDIILIPTVEKRFDSLVEQVETDGSGRSKQAAVKWLRTVLKEKLKKWAACYTSSHFTAGMRATTRSEGLNGVVKRSLKPNTDLTTLLEEMDRMGQVRDFSNLCALERKQLSQMSNDLDSWDTFGIKGVVSTYAYSLLRKQVHLSLGYSIVKVESYSAPTTGEPLLTAHITHNNFKRFCFPQLDSEGKTSSHECLSDHGFCDTCDDHGVATYRLHGTCMGRLNP